MGNRKNTFLLKRSSVAGKVPTNGSILLGEVALNTADAILYTSGTTQGSILPIGWGRVNITGDTMSGPLYAPAFSATTISADTFYGDGSNLTGLPSGNIPDTGIIEANGLSINAFDPSKFDVNLTVGYILDDTTDVLNPISTLINFTGSTGSNPSGITLTYLATAPVTFIGLTGDTTADVVQSLTPFTPTQRRTTLQIGVVAHSNNLTAEFVNAQPVVGVDTNQQMYDLFESLGSFNIGNGDAGNIYGPNGSNLSLDKTSGNVFGSGLNFTNDPKNPHIKTLAAVSALFFRYRTQDSTEGPTIFDVDPNHYDNGGVTALTPSNKFTVQRIIMFPSNNTILQYGQNIYDSLDDAEGSLSTEPFVIESNAESNGLLRGFIITKQGATDLTNVFEVKFIEASTFGRASDTVVGNVIGQKYLITVQLVLEMVVL